MAPGTEDQGQCVGADQVAQEVCGAVPERGAGQARRRQRGLGPRLAAGGLVVGQRVHGAHPRSCEELGEANQTPNASPLRRVVTHLLPREAYTQHQSNAHKLRAGVLRSGMGLL